MYSIISVTVFSLQVSPDKMYYTGIMIFKVIKL